MQKASWYKKKKENENTLGKTQEGVSMPKSNSRKSKYSVMRRNKKDLNKVTQLQSFL